MKQLWFGTAILGILLAMGLWLGSTMEDIHHQPARDLEKAAAAALEEDWTLASALSVRARQDWESRRKLTAALVNHSLLDQIDTGFVRLEIYAARKETTEFGATCLHLSQLLRALPQSHSFSWWNLL